MTLSVGITQVTVGGRKAIRQEKTKSILDALHEWMMLQRLKMPDGSAPAKALDYSLRCWVALIRFAQDG